MSCDAVHFPLTTLSSSRRDPAVAFTGSDSTLLGLRRRRPQTHTIHGARRARLFAPCDLHDAPCSCASKFLARTPAWMQQGRAASRALLCIVLGVSGAGQPDEATSIRYDGAIFSVLGTGANLLGHRYTHALVLYHRPLLIQGLGALGSMFSSSSSTTSV
jgi:hypothetical protein